MRDSLTDVISQSLGLVDISSATFLSTTETEVESPTRISSLSFFVLVWPYYQQELLFLGQLLQHSISFYYFLFVFYYSQILAILRMKPKVAPNPKAIAAICNSPKYIAIEANKYAANLKTP